MLCKNAGLSSNPTPLDITETRGSLWLAVGECGLEFEPPTPLDNAETRGSLSLAGHQSSSR